MPVSNKCAACAVSALFVVAGAGVARAQLQNASFENAGAGGAVFANWFDFNNFGPNIYREIEAVRTGSFSAKLFGQFSGDFNVCGIFQDLPTSVDQVWDAEAYFQHLSSDALGGDPNTFGNRVALNIEFRASNGDLLEYWTVDALTSNSPTDQWLLNQVSGTAPDEAVTARLAVLFIQPDLFGGAAHIDDAALESDATSELLVNPGFEDFGGFGAAYSCRGWAQFPRFAANIFQNSDVPRSGSFAGFMFGQFSGAPNFNGFYQSFPVSAGQQVDAEVWALHKTGDLIGAGNFGFINLEFVDGSGARIGDILTNPGIDSMSPPDVYIQLPVSGVAPPGAERVRVVIGYFQADDLAGGGVHFDDALVTISGQAPCAGDANGDLVVDFNDITSILANWLSDYTPNSGDGDANNDGVVDFNDVTSVLANWLSTCG